MKIFHCIKKYSTQKTLFLFSTEHTDVEGFILKGQVLATLVDGQIVYSQLENNVVDLAKESI